MKFSTLIFILILSIVSLSGQTFEEFNRLFGSALLESRAADFLQKISDGSGGRMVGTPGNQRARAILLSELRQMNLNPIEESIHIPGWIRGTDRVEILAPVHQVLNTVALGYTEKMPDILAPVVFCQSGRQEMFDSVNVKGKIALINSRRVPGQPRMVRANVIRMAASQGARGILFIHSQPGGKVLAGTGDFKGKPLAIPAFSISYEDGFRLKRLSQSDTVQLSLHTESFCKPMVTKNVRLVFPGQKKSRIVIGAHFDSWDLGTGAVDNGIGSAILFDMARLLNQMKGKNKYTVELVWFDGEEWGLWGSKKYVELHGEEDIVCMINLDMTGNPTGLNAMGFSEMVPLLSDFLKKFPGLSMPRGVISRPWTNSDHMDFMFKGIPVVGLLAHLDEETIGGYHNRTDSFDKINPEYLAKATGVATILTIYLANQSTVPPFRYSQQQMIELLTRYHLDKRLKAQHEWPY